MERLLWVTMVIGGVLVAFSLGRWYENWTAWKSRKKARELRRIEPARYLNLRGNTAEIQDVRDTGIGRHRSGYALGTAKQYVSWVMDTGELPTVPMPGLAWDTLVLECVDV